MDAKFVSRVLQPTCPPYNLNYFGIGELGATVFGTK